MQRRTLLALGLVTGTAVTAAGTALGWLAPARRSGRLQSGPSAVMTAVAEAVLDGALPTDPSARAQALAAHLARLERTLSGLPPTMQAEVDQLLSVLASPAGRIGLAGLASPWHQATPQQLSAALQGLRSSSLALRQQTYRALRDLTNSAYFADVTTWPVLGYPGPVSV